MVAEVNPVGKVWRRADDTYWYVDTRQAMEYTIYLLTSEELAHITPSEVMAHRMKCFLPFEELHRPNGDWVLVADSLPVPVESTTEVCQALRDLYEELV